MEKASEVRRMAGPAPEPRTSPVTGAFEAGDVAWGSDGLVPAIVQDARDGAVLMLAWMDREALAATRATGLVHFHSRSRGRLWQKGETSGNVLRLDRMALDCDSDAILVTAHASGPTCHTGRRSCFDGASSTGASDAEASTTAASWPSSQGFESLEMLWRTITERRAVADATASYTARLLAGGVNACARKVTEEATEVLLAARDDAEAERSDSVAGGMDDVELGSHGMSEAIAANRSAAESRRAVLRAALAGEVADLVYHLLVLCAERGLEPAAVMGVLESRRRG